MESTKKPFFTKSELCLLFCVLFFSSQLGVKAGTYCQDRDCEVHTDEQDSGLKYIILTCKISPWRIPTTGGCANVFPSPASTTISERRQGNCPGSYITSHISCTIELVDGKEKIYWTIYCPSTESSNTNVEVPISCCVTCNPLSQTAYCLGVPESNGYEVSYSEYPYPENGCEPGNEVSGEFFPCCVAISPILIDVNGDGYDLTGINNPISFDFNGRGIPLSISWTKANSDDAFLVLDRNGNGIIDNGTELFGNVTPQPTTTTQKNGFLALAEYDKTANGGNNDGKINQADSIFPSLRLWRDKNHNGISESSELRTLPSRDILAIDLDYRESRRQDQFGNLFKFRAKVRDAQGASVGRWAWDVFFKRQN